MNDMSREFEAHDFFRSNRFVDDPYAYFDYLRERAPVVREPHHGIFMVTGYDEAVEILNDPDRFSSCMSTAGPWGNPIPLEGRENDDISELIEQYRDKTWFYDQLPSMDPPQHSDHRALLMTLITPKRLKENEDFMWELADQQIDTFISRGECEFLNAYAQPFAVLVVSDFLGVPVEDRIRFRQQILRNEEKTGGVVVGGMKEGEDASHSPLEWLYGEFSAYIEDRRRNPKADVLTGLANARFLDKSVPTPLEVARIAANLFTAGQETTVRLLSHVFQTVGERPDLQKRLREDRSLIPNFVEESLRIEGPIKGDFRLAKKPTKVGGVDIPAGAFLYVANAAANRDARVFPNPGEFQLDRDNARLNVAFGRGRHACPGAPLARAEAVISLNRMFDRTRDIRISEKMHGPPGARRYNYLPTFILRGVTHLHLEFDPAPAAAR